MKWINKILGNDKTIHLQINCKDADQAKEVKEYIDKCLYNYPSKCNCKT